MVYCHKRDPWLFLKKKKKKRKTYIPQLYIYQIVLVLIGYISKIIQRKTWGIMILDNIRSQSKISSFYNRNSYQINNKCLQKHNCCFIIRRSNIIEPTTAPNTPTSGFSQRNEGREKKTIAGHLCNLFRINCYQNCCLQAICTALSVRNVWRFPLLQAQNAFWGVKHSYRP